MKKLSFKAKIALLSLPIIFITSIFLVLILSKPKRPTATDEIIDTYIDEITGDLVEVRGIGAGAIPPQKETIYPGIHHLLEFGVPFEMLQDIKKMSLEYAKSIEGDGDVRTISFYKNYYKLLSERGKSPMVYKIKMAINNDKEKNIFIKATLRSPLDYDIVIYRDDELTDEFSKYSYCSVLVCKPEKPSTLGPEGLGGGN